MRAIVAGNWKMNMDLQEGKDFLNGLREHVQKTPLESTTLIIGVPYIHLPMAEKFKEAGIFLAAQNCSEHPGGAYTGEISTSMIQSTGAAYVIIGHSERRELYGDTDSVIHQKIKQALDHGLHPILCVGEVLDDRKKGRQESVVQEQLKQALEGLSSSALPRMIIAYEPVWAIGTGETASPEQAEEMHHRIRDFLTTTYNASVADQVPILYGGSVKPVNAREIFSKPNVNGGLIGGASLKLESYTDLVAIAEEQQG